MAGCDGRAAAVDDALRGTRPEVHAEPIPITGGSGFDGSRLLLQLLDQHPGVELHNLGVVPALLPVVNHVALVEDPKTYEALPPVDAVVHLAAVCREPGYRPAGTTR